MKQSVGSAGSLRQQLEKHRTNAVCASCHNRMDTLGFGLENYDATGKWRAKDGKFDIDVSGTMPNGKSFQTPAEMRTLLLDQMPEFTRCITEKMLTYSLGRGLERYDRRTVEGIAESSPPTGIRSRRSSTKSCRACPFQTRRGEAPKAKPTPARQVAQR